MVHSMVSDEIQELGALVEATHCPFVIAVENCSDVFRGWTSISVTLALVFGWSIGFFKHTYV